MKKVCLDAGHCTGENRSPCVFGYSEGTQMWKLHKLVAKSLLERFADVEVSFTRESPTERLTRDGKDVYQRGQKARGADLFLSLHSNATNNIVCDNANYVCVIYPYDGINHTEGKARFIADYVDEAMCETEAELSPPKIFTRKGTGGDYYGVMRGARSVGVTDYFIIEHGFHTNEQNALALLNKENLVTIADEEALMIGALLELTPRDFLVGDVNNDGKIDFKDYAMVKRYLLGTYELTEEQLKRADVNGDGVVSSTDYALLKRKVLGTL